MQRLTREELFGFNPVIESTVSEDGQGVGQREFQWYYEPGKRLTLAEELPLEEMPHMLYLEMWANGGKKSSSLYRTPPETATVHVHNHPSGSLIPSYNDIDTLLKLVIKNGLRDNVIAATQGGKINGYVVLSYEGDPRRAGEMRKTAENEYSRQICLRHDEISAYPERFAHLTIGDDVLTLEEQRRIFLNILPMVDVNYSLHGLTRGLEKPKSEKRPLLDKLLHYRRD